MKRHLLFFVLLLSIVVSACTTKCPPLTDAQKAVIEKQILEIWAKFQNSVENVDFDSFSSFFSSDEFITSFGSGVAFNSKAEYLDTVKARFSIRKSNELQQVTVKVSVLAEDLALLTRSCVLQINFKDGSIRSLQAAVSVIFKKEATGWKIIHRHESTYRI